MADSARQQRPAILVLAVALLAVAACGSARPAGESGTTGSGTAQVRAGAAFTGTITVFAAASLTEAFTALGRQFEAAHRGAHVRFDFDASSSLAQQILQGAPADVFASASVKNMDQIVQGRAAAAPKVFAKNVMTIAVPPSNPAHIASLSDLAAKTVKVALCQPQVPCGATALKVFANAALTVRPVTLEADVKSTITKVELNEVDAALVYVTDVRAAGAKVKGIQIEKSVNASTSYPIAALATAPNQQGAEAFTEFVLSDSGRAVLSRDGFADP
jgi:molybdate transport system substrate-binding protein